MPVNLTDGSSAVTLPDDTRKVGFYTIPLKLPRDRKCSHCILRWDWKSANNWGLCANGTEAMGCGPQEEYRNCADIAIDPALVGIRGNEANRKAIYNDVGQRLPPRNLYLD